MKKLAIIGANDFQNQLILKAKSLGYETHVFAWEDGAVGKETADFFYPISIVEKEEILNICKQIKPDGVCSIASDLACLTVNYVAENLGLPCNKTKYLPIQTNKYQMRVALQNCGIDCPKFITTDNNTFNLSDISDFRFPIIVKPTDRSGSRSVMKLENTDGIEEAIAEAVGSSFENKAIIEEFIDGDEYSMETISFNGKHHYLATTKKFTTGSPHFIERGHKEPSGLSEAVLKNAKDIVFKALDALHVENSAGHSEFLVSADGKISIIEIGARMGGDCIGSDLVYLSTGNDFTKMVIDVSIGNAPIITDCPANKKAEVRFLFTQEDVDELEHLKCSCPEKIYRISPLELENLGASVDSSSRAGYFIIC